MKKAMAIPIPKIVSLSRGIYARVGREVGCDPSYVSRVARKQRRSMRVEAALRREVKNLLARMEATFKSYIENRCSDKSLARRRNRRKRTVFPVPEKSGGQ